MLSFIGFLALLGFCLYVDMTGHVRTSLRWALFVAPVIFFTLGTWQ
jgi:hypothetical protein